MRNLSGLTFAQKVFVLNGGDLNPKPPTLEGRTARDINDEWFDIFIGLRHVESYADGYRRTEAVWLERYGKHRFSDYGAFIIFNTQRRSRGMKSIRL